MPVWQCDECGYYCESDPTGHTDYGGVIRVDGPRCPDPDNEGCQGIPMTCISNGWLEGDRVVEER